MRIKIGDSVRVRPGVSDPDYDFDLSGWQGRVDQIFTTEDEETNIEIAWDSITLKQMPAKAIETSIEEGFEYHLMVLYMDEVDLADPRDEQQDVEKQIDAINKQFDYVNPDEHEKNIKQILECEDLWVSDENQEMFFDYLVEHIKSPCILTGAEDFSWEEPYLLGIFDNTEYESLKKERPSYTDQYKLIRLESIDDLRGILVKVRRISDRKVFILPLWDLKIAERKDKNHLFIDDYSYWMSNFR